ncbi:MAG: hypothetical protein KC609_17650 [Myxococcales bacterium]|nr:hypothetical protein [Myxococcales bacterium]
MKVSLVSIYLLSALVLVACSSSKKKGVIAVTNSSAKNTTGDEVVFSSPDGTFVGSTDLVGSESCVTIGASCVDLSQTTINGKYCDQTEAQKDIVVVDGQVQQVLCSPAPTEASEVKVVQDGTSVEIKDSESNKVVTFDPALDGHSLALDIKSEGNDVTVRGNGEDKTIIDGNVTFKGNNVRLRNVTITGNLEIDGENAAVFFVTVYGNLHSKGNNPTIVSATVHGDFHVEGNNAVLTSNRVVANWKVDSLGDLCADNRSFVDSNQNHLADISELGNSLVCP